MATVFLDNLRITRFLSWSSAKGNTPKWVREQGRQLGALRRAFEGRDLRGLPLADILPVVLGRPHRIRTLKALYGYLRKVTFEIEAGEDPTLHRLVVPVPRPGPSRAVPLPQVAGALRVLRGADHARVDLQAATGLHTTELLRFAQGGRLEPWTGQPGVVAFLEVRHKGGQSHRVALDERLAGVARRVRAAGGFDVQRYIRAVREAGGFTPGRLRHTVATELVNRGANFYDVAAFLGHRTPQTTRRHYARFAVPRNPYL